MNVSDGFMNSFSVQSLYLVSDTLLPLGRLPCTDSSAFPMAADGETCAGPQES